MSDSITVHFKYRIGQRVRVNLEGHREHGHEGSVTQRRYEEISERWFRDGQIFYGLSNRKSYDESVLEPVESEASHDG